MLLIFKDRALYTDVPLLVVLLIRQLQLPIVIQILQGVEFGSDGSIITFYGILKQVV